VATDLAIGLSPVQGILPRDLKGFPVSKDNSDSEKAREVKPLNTQLRADRWLQNDSWEHTCLW